MRLEEFHMHKFENMKGSAISLMPKLISTEIAW